MRTVVIGYVCPDCGKTVRARVNGAPVGKHDRRFEQRGQWGQPGSGLDRGANPCSGIGRPAVPLNAQVHAYVGSARRCAWCVRPATDAVHEEVQP